MRTSKKVFAVLSAAIVTAGVLGGCGSGDAGAGGSDAAGGAAAGGAEGSAAGSVYYLNLMHSGRNWQQHTQRKREFP